MKQHQRELQLLPCWQFRHFQHELKFARSIFSMLFLCVVVVVFCFSQQRMKGDAKTLGSICLLCVERIQCKQRTHLSIALLEIIFLCTIGILAFAVYSLRNNSLSAEIKSKINYTNIVAIFFNLFFASAATAASFDCCALWWFELSSSHANAIEPHSVYKSLSKEWNGKEEE